MNTLFCWIILLLIDSYPFGKFSQIFILDDNRTFIAVFTIMKSYQGNASDNGFVCFICLFCDCIVEVEYLFSVEHYGSQL